MWDDGRALRGEEEACLFPVMGSESATAEIFFQKYRCKSVQYGAFWGKIRILNNSVFNLDFG